MSYRFAGMSACLLFYLTSSFAHFSNLIVFGDSLSDGGNFPESSHIWLNPNAPKDKFNITAQLYVPFSNPVNTTTATFSIPSEKQEKFAWPPLHAQYLSKQPLIESNLTPRLYRSMGWAQFLLSMGHDNHLIESSDIAPSYLLPREKMPSMLSVNYAWGFATTGWGCVNPHYQSIEQCDRNSIETARDTYSKNPSIKNYNQLQIPGIFKQVELFLQDRQTHKIQVDQNTQYTFWFGGNDLIIASNALFHDKDIMPAIEFLMGVSAEHELQSVRFLLHILPKNEQPQKIVIVNLFNPALTPGYYGTKLGMVSAIFVKAHNFWLCLEAGILNLFYHTHIEVLSAYDLYQTNSKNSYFQTHVGQACELSNTNYTDPTLIPTDNCAGYQFWNTVHPAMPMQIITAYRFFNIMNSHNNARP